MIGTFLAPALAFTLMAGGNLPLHLPAQDGSAAASPASDALREDDARVNAIAYRMAIVAAPWCTRLAPVPGWTLHHIAEYDSATQRELAAIYRLDQGPGIVAIAPDSAAALAGLRPGDSILSINDLVLEPLSRPGKKPSRAPGTDVENRIEAELARGEARLAISRAGERQEIRITAPKACRARIRIATSRTENAFADGTYAIFSTKILRTVRSEDELAALVGHELAHNFLRHYDNRRSGSDRRRKRDQEAEADAFALQLMAAAGYDPSSAITMLERLLGFNPLESLGFADHYAKGDRLDQLRAQLRAMAARPDVARWNGVTLPRRR